MKRPYLITLFLLFSFAEFSYSQEWRLYSASDAVNTFEIYENNVWVASGSGLTQIDISTGDKKIWTTLNSALPDYASNAMTIDSNGIVWMAVRSDYESTLIRFDGNDFETMLDINGDKLLYIHDMQTTPNGKVWIYANTIPMSLYLFDQNQFTSISPPSTNLRYDRRTHTNLGIDDQSHIWAVLQDTSTDKRIVGEYDGTQWLLHDVSLFGEEPEAEDAWAHDHIGNIYLLEKHRDTPVLLKYNGTTWSKILLPDNANETQYINQAMYVDYENHVWLLLESNTILQYDGSNWSTIDLNELGFTNGHPEEIILDKTDKWWMMYNHYDNYNNYYRLRYLYQYDGANPHQIDLSNSQIPSNEVSSIIIDELNNKWMRSNYGLLKFTGQDWTLINPTQEIYYLKPIGSNRNGGVWNYPDLSSLVQFDGVTFTKSFITDKEGVPYDGFNATFIDQKGRAILSAWDPNIIVFDHGKITYLDDLLIDAGGGYFFPDYAHSLAVDLNGQIYALGYSVYKLESDSTWTTIPLWDEFLSGFDIIISPDSKIWVSGAYGYDYYIFYVYDGIQWDLFDSQMKLNSFPHWDQDGYPWFKTDQGLCKYENGEWQCYNRTNSPLVPERIRDFTIDRYNNIWITQEYGGVLVFNENEILNVDGEDLPLLSGAVYRDVNQNGILDDTDTPLAYQRQLLLPDSTVAFSSFSGDYHLNSSAGDHEVKYVPRPNWHIDNTPGSYIVTVGNDPISDLNFALATEHEVVDLRLFLNEGFPRCWWRSNYWLSFSNYGTLAESGNIVFIKDPNTEIGNIIPSPSTISGDTLRWSFADLLPFGTQQIQMELLMPGLQDSILEFTGYLDRWVNGEYHRVDSTHVAQDVRCSFDPNDKIARTVRSAGNGKSYLDDPLLYTIRFQNTGNDTAFTIVVRDTLDADLDLNTLEIIGSSHPYEAFLKTDRTLEFRFFNIQLPDSTSNELDSHGFISYSIKAKLELPSPTIIENTAHIYFDFNEAVQTNTAINQLIQFGTGIYNERKIITIINAYPNPTSDVIIIEAMSSVMGSIDYSIIGMQGQVLQNGQIYKGKSNQVSLALLPSGVYLLKATDGESNQVVMLMKE